MASGWHRTAARPPGTSSAASASGSASSSTAWSSTRPRPPGWACLLEHATAPEVIDALDAYLGYPATCPQGQPIPRSIDDAVHGDDRSLADVEVGETVRLVAFDDEGPEVLDYLRRHGLALGVIVRVTELGPRGSLVTVDLPDATAVLGRDIAATIQTVVAEPPAAGHDASPA